MSVIKDIVSGLSAPVVDFFKARQELKSKERQQKLELKDAQHKRQVELISQGLAADATWEIEQIKNSGWKDEYVLIVLSSPMILCFVPWTAPYVLQGFEILERTPDWFRWLVVMVFAAIYGIRVWRRQQYDTE